MAKYKIEEAGCPDSEAVDFLTQKINAETPEYGLALPFGFFIRDSHAKILAGANGFLMFGAIHTDQLWVDSSLRKQGLGRSLMEKVHAHGRMADCSMATVSTISFQKAQDFYLSLGYVCDFERPGYKAGSSFVFLKKML